MQPTQAEAAKDWPKWRKSARRLYLDTNGDINAARGMARSYAKQDGYSMGWAIVIAQLMLILFEWWLNKGVSDPGPIPLAGEPYGE